MHILVDQQRLAGLQDLAGQPFAQWQGRHLFPKCIREMDHVGLRIQQGHVNDIRFEGLAASARRSA